MARLLLTAGDTGAVIFGAQLTALARNHSRTVNQKAEAITASL